MRSSGGSGAGEGAGARRTPRLAAQGLAAPGRLIQCTGGPPAAPAQTRATSVTVRPPSPCSCLRPKGPPDAGNARPPHVAQRGQPGGHPHIPAPSPAPDPERVFDYKPKKEETGARKERCGAPPPLDNIAVIVSAGSPTAPAASTPPTRRRRGLWPSGGARGCALRGAELVGPPTPQQGAPVARGGAAAALPGQLRSRCGLRPRGLPPPLPPARPWPPAAPPKPPGSARGRDVYMRCYMCDRKFTL